MSENFENIASDREKFADSLSDLDIWENVVDNILKLDEPAEMLVDILVGALVDFGMIFGLLARRNREGKLTHKAYEKLLEECLKQLEKHSDEEIVYNPLFFARDLEEYEF